MNKFFLAFSLIFVGINGFSQEFEPSETFSIKGLEWSYLTHLYEYVNIDEDTVHAYLVLNSDTSEYLLDYPIPNVDLYDSVYVKEIVKPGLKNIKSVLLVQFEYAACCYDINAFYYLVTKKGELIPLPMIGYVMCDWPADIDEYAIDPGSGRINKVVNSYNDSGEIVKTEVVESYFWNGKKLEILH